MSAGRHEDRRPLDGVVVISIAVNLPGPVAAARLTELGAEVTTVLPPAGDPLQHYVPELFDALHRDQRLLTLDLKTEDDRRDLEQRLHGADLLLSSSRAAALRRLGLDFDALHERHPWLCQVDIVGFPGEGADLPGHDLSFQAGSGLLSPGQLPRTLIADMHGAEQALSAALTCLYARDRGPQVRAAGSPADPAPRPRKGTAGEGRRVEVALSEAARAMALPWRFGMTASTSPLGGASPLYGIYPAATGHVALAALEPHLAAALVQGAQLEPGEDLHRQLSELFAGRDAEDWQAWGARHGIPVTALAGGRGDRGPETTGPRPPRAWGDTP